MAKFRSIKNSFLAGQISPTAMGRTDLPQYASACQKLLNMIPMVSGGSYRRPGALFDHGFDAAQFTYPRLIPFVVSQNEPYMLALNHDVTAMTSVAGIVNAYRPTDTFTPSTASTVTGHHPYRYDPVTNYHELDEVQFAQSVDVMTVVHPNHKPIRIRRTATDTFNVADFDTDNTGTTLTGAALRDAWPYRPQNSTAIQLSINTASVGTSRTVTASGAFFNAAHVGAVFKSDDGSGTIGCFQVTGFTSPTSVTVSVIVALGTTSGRLTWWESAWSDFRGWPRSIAFFQQRVCYGGNLTDRDSIWFSQSNNFDVLSVAALNQPLGAGDGITTGPLGEQPFTFGISSHQLNLIQWMSPGVTLVVGTLGEEFVITTTSQGFGSLGTEGFGAETGISSSSSQYGSSHLPAARIGSELVFVTQSNDTTRSLAFNLLENAYNSEPIQALFDDFPKPELVSRRKKYRNIAWDESRKTLWCCDTAGNLFGLTREKALQVTTWHTHQMGGFNSTEVETTDPTNLYGQICSGSVISVAVIPNPSLGMNDVWLTVRRKINGDYQYHVERFIGKSIASDTIDTAFLSNAGNYFSDACVYSANGFALGITETFTFSAAHLEGKTLEGTADKIGGRGIFTVSTGAVASGSSILSNPRPPDYLTVGYNVAVGLPFCSIVAPVRLEAGSQIGTAQGAIKRIHKLTMRFFKTLSAKFGPSMDQLETITFRQGETPMNESPELFTGDKTMDFDGDYDREGYVYLVQDKPLPFSVISIIAEGMTDD